MSAQSFRQSHLATNTSSDVQQQKQSHVDYGSNQAQQALLPESSTLDIVGEELGWAGAMMTDLDNLAVNEVSEILPGIDASGALGAASAAVAGVQSFQDSSASTTGGRMLDAILDTSGSLLVGANPAVGLVDTLLPKDMKLSTMMDGGSTAIATMIEGALTGNCDGMEDFMTRAKAGDYTWVMKEAVEAGEFWAK